MNCIDLLLQQKIDQINIRTFSTRNFNIPLFSLSLFPSLFPSLPVSLSLFFWIRDDVLIHCQNKTNSVNHISEFGSIIFHIPMFQCSRWHLLLLLDTRPCKFIPAFSPKTEIVILTKVTFHCTTTNFPFWPIGMHQLPTTPPRQLPVAGF